MFRRFALLVVTGCFSFASAVAAETTLGSQLDFESVDAIPADWVSSGAISINTKQGFNSAHSLAISRKKADVEQPTSLVLPSFSASEGIWELTVDHRSDLDSPDLSFNATIKFEALNEAGDKISASEFRVIAGKSGWQPFAKQAILPSGTTAARFAITLNKAVGTVGIDNLVARFVAPATKTIFTAIKLAPKAYGALFYPGDPVAFDVKVACTEPWADPRLSVAVTDYWGAEQCEALSVDLHAATDNRYEGTLDLSAVTWEAGKYYEIRASTMQGDADTHAEVTSFAILPRPVTKNYRPHEIPFTLNNWDDRVKDTFFMADRIGIRWKLIWAGWSEEAPYEPYAPGIEWIKELDMGAVLGPRAVGEIEKHRKGYERWTEESLRQGAYNMVMAYKDEVPLMIRCGNEPHTEPAIVSDAVKAYKAVYEGAKKADPNIFFIGTSIGPNEEFFKQGFSQYCDAYDYHTYSGWKRLRDFTTDYKAMFEKYQVEPKPIYCTEIGLNSQGMARIDVARDMAKKFAIHFAEGHANLAWFDLLYPDPKGTIAGSNGEAFNVFNTKYALYSPKITAVMYYNLVNGICIKKAVEEKIYAEEIEAVLFRDVDQRNLLVLWNELGREEAFVPLPGVGAVRLVRIDGSELQLDAGGKGLTLTLDQDPLLLHFESADLHLAEKLQPAQVALHGELPTIVKGSTARLQVDLAGIDASTLVADVPFGWHAEAVEPKDGAGAAFTITAPEQTAATEGRIAIRAKDGSVALSLPVSVTGKLSLTVLPLAFGAGPDGAAGVRAVIRNHGVSDEKVRYVVSLPSEIAMEGGTFHKSHATPYAPRFLADANGEVAVAAGASVEVVVPVAGLDPKSLYRAQVSLTGAGPESVQVERYLAGFAAVPKVAKPLTLDPVRDDADWQRAAPVSINEDKQYRRYRQESEPAAWTGVNDLSATLRFLWDDQYLYIRADIIDEIYVHGKKDSDLWAMDGIQILVDPNRDSANKSGYYDISMGEGLAGDQAWCNSSAHPTVQAGAATGIKVKTTPSKASAGSRIQVVAIPWAHLAPFQPALGSDLGLALIVNEDDGPGRGSFMGWFGCVHSKQLDLVGDLILSE